MSATRPPHDVVVAQYGLADILQPQTELLADGTVGYFVRIPRTDDCFAAAIATVLQVPIERIPDPRLDERLDAGEPADEIDRSFVEALHRWLAKRGLRPVVHRKHDTDHPPISRGP